MRDETEREGLTQEASHILEEARMVLPGVQALFGFQTIVVFNEKFDELPDELRLLHLGALMLCLLAIALLMAPAALHRIAVGRDLSRRLVELSSILICSALLPLMISLSLDVFVVLEQVTQRRAPSIAAAGAVLVVFLGLWFAFPLYMRRQRRKW